MAPSPIAPGVSQMAIEHDRAPSQDRTTRAAACPAMSLKAGLRKTLLAFLMASLSAVAAAQERFPVYISATDEDQVGRLLVYELREQLAKSSIFSVKAPGQSNYFELSIVTLDPRNTTAGAEQTSTVYSVSFLWSLDKDPSLPFFLSSNVGLCGSSRVIACANDILAFTSHLYDTTIKKR